MATTVLVEPDPGGHRLQSVANVAEFARRFGEVLLLTSEQALTSPAYAEYLDGVELRVEAPFDGIHPDTARMAAEVAAVCRREEVATAVVMDADQSLKRWWYTAPRAFRGLARRPRVVFMLTRYPARVRPGDRIGWLLRVSKATLSLAAMATRSLHHVSAYAGRDDTRPGWIVKRTRDPDICTAHSRDRAGIRAELGLPAERRIAGIFGVIGARKNIPLVWEAMQTAGVEADLLVAGEVKPEVASWLESVPPSDLGRVLVRDGFLSNAEMDKLVAAVDVVPIALTNNGPSGIMGKALAAGVPVVTAGSTVRASELRSVDGGETADLDAASIGAAIARALAREGGPSRSAAPLVSVEEYAASLLGVDPDGRVRGRFRYAPARPST